MLRAARHIKEVLMSKETIEHKLETARKLEAAIHRIRDNKEKITVVFSDLGLPYKPKTYYALKKKYEDSGLSGLISQKHRCGRKAIASTNEVRQFIINLKERNPEITGKGIQGKLDENYGNALSVCQINKIIQQSNIKAVQGRPAQAKEQSLNCAGSIIFKAAVIETNYLERLIKAQKGSISTRLGAVESGCDDGRTYEEKGIFSKDEGGKFTKYPVENAEDYAANGGISRKFMGVGEKKAGKNLKRTAISAVGEKTLYQKNMALLSLPIFTEHSRFGEINETKGNELAYLAGFDYKSNTIDRFAREMKYFQISDQLLRMTAGFYLNLWQERTREDVKLVCYYFDGHRKPLWSSYSVKQSSVSKVGRVMGCLEQVFVHSGLGYPIMLQTFAGGVYLPDAIKKLHSDIKKIMPGTGSRISIFDGGGNSVEFYETFKDDDYFICILDNNQYKQDLSDFNISQKEESGEELFIEAKKKLINSKTKNSYTARTPIYKKAGKDKHVAFVTDIPNTEATAREVIQMYYGRWPCQELDLRNMNMGIHLSTNYGYGKIKVTNLVVQEKKAYLKVQIEKKRKNINMISKSIDDLKIRIETENQEKKVSQKNHQLKRKEIENQIKRGANSMDISKLLKELNRLNMEKEKGELTKAKSEWKSKREIEKSGQKKKNQEKSVKKQEREYERISKKELVYKNDVELDQLMGMYKIAFANLSAFVLREYFGELHISLESLINKVFKRPGKMITRGKEKIIYIYLNKKDQKMGEHIKKACDVINSKLINQRDGSVLKIEGIYT